MLDEKPGLQRLRSRIVQLRAMPGFAVLDVETLELLAESSRVRRFRKGDAILALGAPVEHVYLAIEGGIESRRGSLKLDIENFGGVGFLSLLAGDARGVDAIATGDVRVLEVRAETALRVMSESFVITRIAIRSLARQLVARWGAMPPSDGPPQDVDVGTKRDKPLTLVQRLLMLRRTPLGRYANLDASSEMARAMTEVHVAAGETLFAKGDPSTFWLGVEFGRVRCDGATGEVGWVGARKVLGVLESWADTPRSFAAIAETELVVHRIDVASMLAVAEIHPEMGVQLARLLARQLVASEEGPASLRGGAERGPSPREAARPRPSSHPPPDPLHLGPNEG
jgi:CRP/FNR family cyclic AMP-dependent transcriptional regulator